MRLFDLHRELRRHFEGRVRLEGWWPGRTRFELIAGALLVRNTNWGNAALALASLRRAGRLSPRRLGELSEAELGGLIRSAGTWREKARCLLEFVHWLEARHGGSLHRLFAQPLDVARAQLLERRGIGPETADAILLYAGGRATFVVDAYTRRVFARHRLGPYDAPYEELRGWCQTQLPADAALYQETHALLVETGKAYCRKTDPRCDVCPLGRYKNFTPRRQDAKGR